MSRSTFKAQKEKRDAGQFVALPASVLKSPAYRAASHVDRSLLIDIAMQFKGNNNGRLVACLKYLRPLGWNSNATLGRALRSLLALGLLVETRKGGFPNTPTWFALTWCDLDVHEDFDIDPRHFQRGAYRGPPTQNAPLVPRAGAARAPIAPAGGVGPSRIAPAGGAIPVRSTPSPAPSGGEYLEMPSAGPLGPG